MGNNSNVPVPEATLTAPAKSAAPEKSTSGQGGGSSTASTIQAGAAVVGDILNVGLNIWAMNEAVKQADRQNAEMATQYQVETAKEERRYNAQEKKAQLANSYNKMISDHTLLKQFGGEIQNYLNSGEASANNLVSIWRKAA